MMKAIRVRITSEACEVPEGQSPASVKLKQLQAAMGYALYPGAGKKVDQWEVVERLLRDADPEYYRDNFTRLLCGRAGGPKGGGTT